MTSMYSVRYDGPSSTQSRKAAPAKQEKNTGNYAGLKVEVTTPPKAISYARKHVQGLIQGNKKSPAPTTVAFGRSVPLHTAKNTSKTLSPVARQSATSRLGSAQRDILGNRGNKPVALPADFKQSELPRAANVRRQPAVVAKKTASAPTAKKQPATSPLGAGERKPNPRWVN